MSNELKGLSRREFVVGSGALAAGLALPLDLASAAGLRSMEHTALLPHVGSRVRLSRGDLTGSARITSVTPMGSRQVTPAGVRSQAFEIILEAGFSVVPYTEGTFKISHSALGTFDLHLAPCGDNVCDGRLRAIFN